MEKEQIQNLLQSIITEGMCPNEYFVLFLHLQSKAVPKNINEDLYTKKLIKKGLLDEGRRPTAKVKELGLFDDVDIEYSFFETKVDEYKKCWPSILLPSGKYARSDVKELREKFKWFFANFDYSWEIILTATSEYVRFYADRNFMYMKTASYFIYKEDRSKIKTSELAQWCDKVSTGDDVFSHGFDINV